MTRISTNSAIQGKGGTKTQEPLIQNLRFWSHTQRKYCIYGAIFVAVILLKKENLLGTKTECEFVTVSLHVT